MRRKDKTNETVSEPAIRTKLALLAGVLLALFIAAVGLQLNSAGRFNSQPYGDNGQIVLVITLAVSFGYDLGLAMKTTHPERGVFLFWASFLGTFFTIVVSAAILSIVLGASFTAVYSIAPLILGTGAFAVIIQSELVEHSRMRFLKHGLDTFSNRISAALFGGYGVATVSDPSLGAIVGGVVLIISLLIPSLLSQLKERLDVEN